MILKISLSLFKHGQHIILTWSQRHLCYFLLHKKTKTKTKTIHLEWVIFIFSALRSSPISTKIVVLTLALLANVVYVASVEQHFVFVLDCNFWRAVCQYHHFFYFLFLQVRVFAPVWFLVFVNIAHLHFPHWHWPWFEQIRPLSSWHAVVSSKLSSWPVLLL